MIKKILCLLFCTIVIITVFPISVFSLKTGVLKSLITKSVSSEEVLSVLHSLTTLDDMPNLNHLPIIKNVVSQPVPKVICTKDIVIQMIEKIDESVILGYLENLTSFGPRVTGTSACVAAAQYIFNEFLSMGLNVRYDNWNKSGYSSNNVEATLNGTDKYSDEIYIVCGHYDSVPGSPGADDDGSGVATTIAAAYMLSQYTFNHTIRFVAFSGEEQGLLGSESYAAEAVANGWNVKGVLNADMISYAITQTDGNNLKVYEDTASEWLYMFTNTVETEYSSYIDLNLQHGGYTWGSDHNSFWDHGYNGLFYFEFTETPYYHSSGDTIAHMNTTYLKKNVRLIIATLAELAELPTSRAPDVPTVIGPTKGVANKEYIYTVVTTDPDGDDVYYFVDWGDGTNIGWIGPYNSGEKASINYTWKEQGIYTIKAKAKDVYGSESDLATLTVTMPRNKIFDKSLVQFLQNFPESHLNLFSILQKLIQRLKQ